MEKGNVAGLGDFEALAAADPSGLVETTTSVTTVVSGLGADAAESLKDQAIDKVSEAAIAEARERVRRDRDGDGTSTGQPGGPVE